jgi:hypothetical protein
VVISSTVTEAIGWLVKSTLAASMICARLFARRSRPISARRLKSTLANFRPDLTPTNFSY